MHQINKNDFFFGGGLTKMVVLVFWATYGKSWVLVSTLGSRKSQIFIMLAGPCSRVLCPTSDMGPGSQASILRKCLGSRVSLLV